jgi:hypothetical protein
MSEIAWRKSSATRLFLKLVILGDSLGANRPDGVCRSIMYDFYAGIYDFG